MKATLPPAGIPTVAHLARARRCLDRQRRAVSRPRCHAPRRNLAPLVRAGLRMVGLVQWLERAGRRRAILIARPDVQAVGDTLFSNTRSQTWRYCGSHKGDG
jgi:hypothetical protein